MRATWWTPWITMLPGGCRLYKGQGVVAASQGFGWGEAGGGWGGAARRRCCAVLSACARGLSAVLSAPRCPSTACKRAVRRVHAGAKGAPTVVELARGRGAATRGRVDSARRGRQRARRGPGQRRGAAGARDQPVMMMMGASQRGSGSAGARRGRDWAREARKHRDRLSRPTRPHVKLRATIGATRARERPNGAAQREEASMAGRLGAARSAGRLERGSQRRLSRPGGSGGKSGQRRGGRARSGTRRMAHGGCSLAASYSNPQAGPLRCLKEQPVIKRWAGRQGRGWLLLLL